MAKNKIKCFKCFITLEYLKKENIAEYLVKVIKEDGKEDYICPNCLEGF
ncbi:MAG: hypothetical protein ABIH59_00075 [archaeon]